MLKAHVSTVCVSYVPPLTGNVSSSVTLQNICVSHLALPPPLSSSKQFIFHSLISLWFSVSSDFFLLSCLPPPFPPSLWALARGVRRFQLTEQKPCSPPPLFKNRRVFLSSSSCCTANNWEERKVRLVKRERETIDREKGQNTSVISNCISHDALLHMGPCPHPLLPSNTRVISQMVIRLLIEVNTVSFRKVAVSSLHCASFQKERRSHGRQKMT